MNRHDTIEALASAGIIAIVRARSAASLNKIAEALHAGGVTAIEATLTTPGALQSVRDLPNSVREKMLVGIGTVLDASSAREAADAGASFIVTPVVRLEVVAACNEMGIPVACGAFTPTEALNAHEAGADIIKIFPADTVGPAYIKALLAPLPMLRIMPTGGVTPETVGPFLKAGCVALGAGSRLVSKEIVEAEDWPALTARARDFSGALRAARASGYGRH